METPRAQFGIPLFVVVATFLLGIWTFDDKLSLSGDNAEFITLAHSLAQGEGLLHINSPDPQPATKYPFGFPLLLAPLAWAFPGDWVPMKAWVLVLFALGMGILYQLAKERVGTVPGLAVVVLSVVLGKSYLTNGPTGTAYGPLLLHYSHQVMSEVPYLTFSLLALWLVEQGVGREGLKGNWWLVGGFACTIWAYYIRTAGIALVAAVGVYLLLRRDFGGVCSLAARRLSAGCRGHCAIRRWAVVASISSSSSWSIPTTQSGACSTWAVLSSALSAIRIAI